MMNVFRDAGMEVIYTGRFCPEKEVASAAVTEDVDLIAVSDLSGSLPIICDKLLTELRALGADIPLICGGLMTDEDRDQMLVMGVKGCFETGSSIDQCLNVVMEILGKRPAV